MNSNAVIAVLVIKNIITLEEGEALVDHLGNKPQSTVLSDSISAVGEIIAAPAPAAILPQINNMAGPEQRNEEIAARSAQPTAPVAPPPEPAIPENNRPDEVLEADKDKSPEPAHTDDKSTDKKSEQKAQPKKSGKAANKK